MTTGKIKQLSQEKLISLVSAPGAQYIVVDDNKILTECNAGFANLQQENPVTSKTTFNAFSVTKTATAAAVLKLVESKKISLTDFVNPIFNEFHFKYPFTLQQLLSHEAGFPDPIPISWIHQANGDADFNEPKFIRDLIDKHSDQKFIPGSKFSYSSIGYLLLGQLIERISGESFEAFIKKNVVPDLSENNQLGFIIPDAAIQATGYHPRFSFSNLLLSFFLDRKKFISSGSGSFISFNNFLVNGKAYGGFVGNVRGLAQYLQQYLKNKMFVDSSTQELMFTEQKGGMALGWFTGTLNGNKYVCHAGGGGGYYCEIRIYPELKIASAMLRNKSSFGDLRLLNKIDNETIF